MAAIFESNIFPLQLAPAGRRILQVSALHRAPAHGSIAAWRTSWSGRSEIGPVRVADALTARGAVTEGVAADGSRNALRPQLLRKSVPHHRLLPRQHMTFAFAQELNVHSPASTHMSKQVFYIYMVVSKYLHKQQHRSIGPFTGKTVNVNQPDTKLRCLPRSEQRLGVPSRVASAAAGTPATAWVPGGFGG
jgi:hypothetical protein